MAKDISDFYIKGERDPLYDDNRLENVTFLETVIAKLYMILLTNKGDVYGDPNFGADIPKFLWKTKYPASTIKTNIEEQIEQHIPELTRNDYEIDVYILPGNYQDIGIVQIDLGISNVNVLFR